MTEKQNFLKFKDGKPVGAVIYSYGKKMTENERYTIKPQDDLFGVVDNYSADKICVVNGICTEIEAEWLCKDMNTLNDENEQLKQTNQELNDELQETMGYLALKSGVEKENEQLKSEINMLKVTIGRNEAHIKRLTEKSNWRTSAYD